MDAMDCILTRRSIRKYTGDIIPDDIIDELLKAAMSAPAAGSQDPWHFILIKDRAVLEKVPEVHPYARMVPDAYAAILVCWDPTIEKHKGFGEQDCSAATENILLAAQARGLGAVWLGCYPREDRVNGLRGLLGIPEHVIPFALVPFGRPDEEKGPALRWKEDRIHRNGW